MIQPVFLQAFASTPVQIAASRQTSGSLACATCGQSGCNCGTAAQQAAGVQPVDELELSAAAQAIAEQSGEIRPEPPSDSSEADPVSGAADAAPEGPEVGEEHDRQVRGDRPQGGEEVEESGADLSEEEQEKVTELKSRDREVRSHEQAHLAAAGPYATGGPSFSYQEGPDGRRYAVGGEVGIDTSPVSGDPEATILKAQQIRAAALAPASPSGQDQRVAAAATQMESQARAELSKQNQPKSSAATSSYEDGETDLTGTLLDLVA